MQEFRSAERLEKAMAGIANDKRSGASELASRGVKLFAAAAPREGISAPRYSRAVRRVAVRLSLLRPSMTPIAGAVARLLYDFHEHARDLDDTAEVYAVLRNASVRQQRKLDAAADGVAANFVERFARIRRPMVISYSSRVLKALTAKGRRGRHVTVCESRPALEGRRTARLLTGRVGSVTLITESQAGLAMKDCDGVVLGCDAIHPDGSIVNKTGSYMLALAARARRRPVIVLGDSYRLAHAATLHESHAETQVWRQPARGVRVTNVCFETIPGNLVDFIIMESGVHRPRAVARLWRTVRKYRAVLDPPRH